MHWLRWHYHVKDIAGAPYKIKQKRQKRRQTVVTGRQQLYCAVQSWSPNHRQTSSQQSKNYSAQLATKRSQRLCIPDSWRQAVPRTSAEATGKARSPSTERLVDGTTSMAVSAERRWRPVSTSDVRFKLSWTMFNLPPQENFSCTHMYRC